MRGWKQVFHANGKEKKAGVAILISDKIDFKVKMFKTEEESCIMIKESNHQEDIKNYKICMHSPICSEHLNM